MSAFTDAFAVVIGNEGGYNDDPNDSGNWSSGQVGVGTLDGTMYGVSAPVARENGYTGPMRDLPLSLAQSIAKAKYWDPVHGDELPPSVATQIFDAAYNSGDHRAERWLQQAVGVRVDGDIGPQTLAAVAALDPDKIVMRFDAIRLRFMASLPIWPRYGAGWANRIADNLMRAAS